MPRSPSANRFCCSHHRFALICVHQRSSVVRLTLPLYFLYLLHLLNYPRSMRQQPTRRKLSTETQLYMSAQRALMRRAHSIHEMKQHLERRAENKDLIPAIIARLRELNYLDDAKYALNYAAQHVKVRRQGRFRIARELRARGVPDRYIDDAIATVFADTDEPALIRTRLKRRLALLKRKSGEVNAPIDQKKIASLYRNLLGAGFSADVIRAELKRVTNGDLPEDSDISVDDP
jgi:SOS response regulatory protein OraA/RecX